MAFVVPQHLPRAGYGQSSGHGSTTSHAEPILRKLAEATRGSLTAAEASKWAGELQKNIDDTKTRVHQCIHKDLPAFERQLTSAKQIQSGLEGLALATDDLTGRVQSPQSGLLPTVLTTLSAHSTLAQNALDAKILHNALAYLAQCRDEFKTLSTLVQDGHLPAAVLKADEAQSLIQSAPRPLESSAVMRDLSRMARVLGDRVQEQLGDAYSRAIAVTSFPTGVTVVVLPHVKIRDSNGVVTLSELFTSLQTASLKEHLSTLRKEILSRALEPILTKHSRLVVSAQESTLTVDHGLPQDDDGPASAQDAHQALQHTTSLITFLHDTLFPALPPQDMFAAQLATPLAQALIKHVLKPSIPRSGSLDEIPEFLRIVARAAEVEETLFKMGLRTGDVREWAQAAPTHYERLRREDLIQQVRSVVLEHGGAAVTVTRTLVHEEDNKAAKAEEDDPWAFEEPAPAPPSVPIIATPTPKSPPAVSAVPAVAPYVIGEPPKPPSPTPEEPEEDGWGFDDEEIETSEPAKAPNGTHGHDSAHDTSEDEPDVEVYAGMSQSEGAGTGTSESRSEGTSHQTELLSAPQSDAEIVNAAQSSEESDPWDDDPWADQEEDEIKPEPETAPIAPSKSPAPTLSPTKGPEPPKPAAQTKPASPTKPSPTKLAPIPAVVETPPSPAVKAPAPRAARGLERFAQKNRGSPSPTPSKFSSPIVSNSSPTASFAPSSAFGTAPSSAFPTSAISNSPYASPTKSSAPLPNPQMSPPRRFTTPEPPKIAPPMTPAMRRAQQQAKTQRPASPLGVGSSPYGHFVDSPTKKRNAVQQDDQSSVVSISGLFGNGGASRAGSEVGFGSQVGVGSQVGIGSQVGARSQVGMGSQVGVGSQVGAGSQVGIASPEREAVAPVAKDKPTTETYMVSRKAQRVFALAEDALKEGKALVSSNVFPPNTSPTPGTLVLGCIPSFFDLFRALVPVAHEAPMAASAGIAMRFSNDCTYLSEEIAHIIADVPRGPVGDVIRPKLQETQERLKMLGESWFEEVLDNEKQAITKYLESTDGLKDLQDQARYQDCRRAITRCTQAVTKFSRDTKPVLSFAKYHLALGTLVEDILTHLTDDILAMHDIPETESHRLHDICKIVHGLETLFIPDGETASMVTHYVPSWFKHSYLSELLEASLADIRHLFDMGALVDFSEQDLAHLIRALFSDSPKRQELVDRVLAGHPVQA